MSTGYGPNSPEVTEAAAIIGNKADIIAKAARSRGDTNKANRIIAAASARIAQLSANGISEEEYQTIISDKPVGS